MTAALIGGLIVGCASSEEDTFIAPDETTPTTGSKLGDDDDERPVFEAGFQPEKDGGPSTRSDASSTPSDAAPPTGSCTDPNDPGGAENVARVLTVTDDCDDTMKPVTGVLNSAVDVDYYNLSAEDDLLCFRDTDFEVKTAGTELCVFAKCAGSTANAVTGCISGTTATSDTGIKGCCTNGPGHAVPDFDCSGFTDDDSANFVIRVKATSSANSCLPYTFSYRF